MRRAGAGAVLCHPNASHRESVLAAEDLSMRLTEAGFEVQRGLAAFSEEGTRLILLLGGDGFLMESLHTLDFPPTPVFGVNFGTVGFLMNSRKCLPELAATIERGDFLEERHAVLEARARLEDGREETVRAFNDFIIERMSGQSIRLKVFIDGHLFNRYSGDGLVLATAAGSTAYNLAAGGPVLHPGLQTIVVTPLYPHRAAPFHSLRFSFLMPLECRVRVEADDVSKRSMRLLADGRPLERVVAIEVRDSGRRVHLLRTRDHVFFGTLSRKFIGEAD
jgi:NAD+ kinase